MNYSQKQTLHIKCIFNYEDILHLLTSIISFIKNSYNQSNDSRISINITGSKGQSFSFQSLEDFIKNFSRSNYIDSVSFEMFFIDPSNNNDYIFIRNHFISNISIELNVSSASQTFSQDLVDNQSKIISHYIDEQYPLTKKPTIINKIDNILSNSKLAYMIIGALITASINFLVKLFTK